MPQQSRLSTFVNELRRRKVFRVLAIYAGAAFIILQVMDGMSDVLALPQWAGKLVVAGLLVGFPVSALLAWVFDLTAHGVIRTPDQVETSVPMDEKAVRAAASSGPSTIAVMPFADFSAEKDQDYFCDGMAEEVIETLARIPGIDVVSRTSTFAFKGRKEDIRKIGLELGVSTILEGSVRKSGNRLRITVQLIDVASGYHLWSERYDRDLEDIFAVQDEIATNIVKSLKGVLSEEEIETISASLTDNIEAYDFYLRGREFFHRANLESLQFAIGMFTRAIEIDPQYARAYAGLADCHSWSHLYFGAAESKVEAAIEASRKALEMGPDLAEAHVSYGWAVSLHGQYELAESEFETAIGMNLKLYEAYYFYARMCWAQGKMEQAAQLFEKAAEVNPQDYQVLALVVAVYDKLDNKAQMDSARRRAISLIERHLELNPDDARALTFGAGLLIGQGERKRGLEFAERAIAIDPDNLSIAYNVACAHARAGNTEKALDYLSKVLLAGFAGKEWVENDGDLTSLHGHPRFQELLDQMDSPD